MVAEQKFNFEKGKWYRRKDTWEESKPSYAYYFRCEENSTKSVFLCSETIRRNGTYEKESHASERNDILNIPVDLNIIIPFLPLKHSDRKVQINNVISNIVIW